MILRDSIWDKIRGKFDVVDKAALEAASTGRTYDVPGVVIDTHKLEPDLRERLLNAVHEAL